MANLAGDNWLSWLTFGGREKGEPWGDAHWLGSFLASSALDLQTRVGKSQELNDMPLVCNWLIHLCVIY